MRRKSSGKKREKFVF